MMIIICLHNLCINIYESICEHIMKYIIDKQLMKYVNE